MQEVMQPPTQANKPPPTPENNPQPVAEYDLPIRLSSAKKTTTPENKPTTTSTADEEKSPIATEELASILKDFQVTNHPLFYTTASASRLRLNLVVASSKRL